MAIMSMICIYHGNCADGFGAAWVVRKAFGADVEFYPGVYQTSPPDVTGKDVLLVDFSYKRPVLLEMAKCARSVMIIDHHKTAEADLIDLPENVTTIFDQSHSGAVLTWMTFFVDSPPPELLLHIEDRDLWKFLLPGTKEVLANVFLFPYSFEVWDRLMGMPIESLISDGKAIERKHFKDIEELLKIVTREMDIGGHRVPVANLPYTMASDAGHELSKGRPFAACYWDTPEGRMFSLRSNENGLDVSEVAKQYGGGGHKHAAGFRLGYADAFIIGGQNNA